MSGIPLYPYRVVITYHTSTGRPSVTRSCADLPSAMAVFNENIGKQVVHNVEVLLTIHKYSTGTNVARIGATYLNKR